MSVVVRFAPSPTGYLHIGGARTALFNYLFAKNKNGKFLLRIEDTDKDRLAEAAIDAILEGLNWLGLKHDGDFVLQSKNKNRHVEIANKLLEKNMAYLCYTSAEELDALRGEAEKKGETFRFKSPWRNQVMSQSSDIKPVIRIKAPLDGETVIYDLVQGEVRVKNSELDDFVLLRSDGTPTYMLAVVVDDFDMEISHIIRGDDHLTNAFRQKIIYEAMGWKVPQFAHIPLIHGSDGAKMSKRHGATSVIEYKQMGYLPEAMRNYLLRLGWSHGNAEIISDIEAVNWFDVNKIGKSPSRFDFAKLNHLNKNYIKQKTESELLDLLVNFMNKKSQRDFSFIEQERLKKALKFLKDKAETLVELGNFANIYLNDFRIEFDESSRSIISEKSQIILEIKRLFAGLNDWNHDEIKKVFDQFSLSSGLKIKDFGPVIRLLLTFSLSSAGGVFDIVEILGKDEVLLRIRDALKKAQ